MHSVEKPKFNSPRLSGIAPKFLENGNKVNHSFCDNSFKSFILEDKDRFGSTAKADKKIKVNSDKDLT